MSRPKSFRVLFREMLMNLEIVHVATVARKQAISVKSRINQMVRAHPDLYN